MIRRPTPSPRRRGDLIPVELTNRECLAPPFKSSNNGRAEAIKSRRLARGEGRGGDVVWADHDNAS